MTKATGVKKVVEKIFDKLGEDCGCEERQAEWDDKYRFFTRQLKPKCLTKDQYERLKKALAEAKQFIPRETAIELATLYSEIFGTRYKLWCGHCDQIWKTKVEHLKAVLAGYETKSDKK